MKSSKVIVIGAGASGMTAAIAASRSNAQVTILEHNDSCGKKILATGNGRCNFTNMIQNPKCYRSDNADFAWKIINKFDHNDTLSFFKEMGILPKQKNGYVYPYSEQATAVRDVLVLELLKENVEIITNTEIKDIEKRKEGPHEFLVTTDSAKYECDSIIICTGSKASSCTGSDGSGYELAKRLGHNIIKPLPALVQLRCEGSFFKMVSGVRCDARITLFCNNQKIASDRGELQLTDYGISGIPTFQISRYASKALDSNENTQAVIDFMPQMDDLAFKQYIAERISYCEDKTLEQFFIGMINKKLASALIKKAHLSPQIKVNALSQKHIKALINEIKDFKVKINSANPYENAQVCCGGVDTLELTENMQSKLVDGIFFAGEIVDVDGICGGYNLQWAWSSGYIAGVEAANRRK